MARNADGITDFTKSLIILARSLNKTDYNLVTNVMFSLHNGVSFGYRREFDPSMMGDAMYIYKIHKPKKYKGNIVKLKLVKSSKDAHIKL
tara:strand:+ start:738 stop:1007 length:270 start_codon:yes stop_codon:yes gene_type:complete